MKILQLVLFILCVIDFWMPTFSISSERGDLDLSHPLTIYCATSFLVEQKSPISDECETVFSISKSGNEIITSVAYDHNNRRIAIAIKQKEPVNGSAKIILIDDISYKKTEEIITQKDRISYMRFSNSGRIVFVAGKTNLRLTQELCYINDEQVVVLLDDNKKYFSPSWSNNSDAIYFAYLKDSKRIVGYVNINSPKHVHVIADGVSICASSINEYIAYLDSVGNIFLLRNKDAIKEKLSISSEYTNPKFTNVIRFARGSNDLIFQIFINASYELVLYSMKSMEGKVILSATQLQDFDVRGGARGEGPRVVKSRGSGHVK